MESLNTWNGGMNSDISKSLQKANSYVEAYNFRILNQESQTSGVLSNVRGTEFAMSFPNTGNVIKIQLTSRILPASGFTISFSFLYNGITTGPFSITITYSGIFNTVSDFFAIIADQINNDPALTVYGVSAYSDGSGVFVTCKPQSTSASIPLDYPVITVTSLPVELTSIETVPVQIGLVPIGSTNIRDEIYIITTSKLNINTGGYGQIWKLSYDSSYIDQYPLPQSSTLFTLDLLYNNALNLDLSHPIAPTAIVGNFENPTTKVIYWCDFKNKIRKFNAADSNGFWLDPSILLSVPTVDFSIPVLQKVETGGSLKSGMYQYTYRLTNGSGTETKWSLPSAASHIVLTPESDTITTYQGTFDTANSSGKANRIKITGIDTDFDRIQIAYIYRTTVNGPPLKIQQFAEEPVNKSTGTIDIVHTGTESEFPITLAEFQTYNYSPDTCKTMATKFNVLLIGNVKSAKLDLDFDARAFRYSLNSTTTYWDGVTGPDLLDDVNPNQEPDSYNNYLYQKNSNVLGGTGPNISYKFKIQQTNADNQLTNDGIPYRDTKLTTQNIDYNTDIVYPVDNAHLDTRNPNIAQVVRGLQRDETYRFGIVFFDLEGNPGWTKWIGDIKVPHIYMPDTTSSDPLDRTSQFPLVVNSGSDFNFNNIGLEFTVDVSSVKSLISGYSIVRVKREQKDKTVLAQGILHPALQEGNATYLTNYTYVWPEPGGTTIPGVHIKYDTNFFHILSPELRFVDGIQSPPLTSDGGTYVEIVDTLLQNAVLGVDKVGGGKVPRSEIHKNYSSSNAIINSTYRQGSGIGAGAICKKIAVSDINYVDCFANVEQPYTLKDSNGNATSVWNRTIGTKYSSFGGGQIGDGNSDPVCSDGVYSSGGVCQGDNTTVFTVDYTNPSAPNTVNYGLFFDNVNQGYPTQAWTDGLLDVNTAEVDCGGSDKIYGTRRKYLANVKRVISNQYGGSSLSQRSTNDYIFCNHYQPVNSNSIAHTSDVFGGDTFVEVMDYAYQKYGFRNPHVGNKKRLVGFFWPSETTLNLELRDKTSTLNTTAYPTTDTGIMTQDGVSLNPVYSVESDYVSFFPKPIPFKETVDFDTRIYASGVKINGEQIDSWSKFAPIDYIDVDGIYGPINSLLTFKNQVYFYQDRAFGIVPVFPRAVLNNGGTPDTLLQLGIGNKIDKQQYASTDTGTKHQWSTMATGDSIYWYDVLSKKMYRYQGGSQKLSDIKGLHTYFDKSLQGEFLKYDNPILEKGVCCVYDYKNNEVIYTFHDQDIPSDIQQDMGGNEVPITYNKFTVAFNEITDTFTSFYNFYPFIYITNRQVYLSPDHTSLDLANNLYIHNKGPYCNFYNFVYPSTVKLIVNDRVSFTKKFNNLVLNTESVDRTNNQFINQNDDTFDYIRVYNDYQNTDYQPFILNSNIKRKERNWNLQVPRNRVLYTGTNSPNIFADLSVGEKDYGERLSDKYITVDLRYDNRNNYNLLFHYLKTQYLISAR